MSADIRHHKACIIGAGPCGLTTISNFLANGVKDFVCYEAQEDIGGLWLYSDDPDRPSVYEHAHIISSKRLSTFRQCPQPADYPDFPSHRQMLGYFRDYADRYDLRRHIRLKTRVESVERTEDGTWRLTITDPSGTREETADNLIVASGHHRIPLAPGIDGEFTGEQLHSGQYRNTRGFENKRVLVVGAGNSACDIAAALSRVADHVSLSMRTPQYIIPKSFIGRPIDVHFRKMQKLPRFLRNAMLRFGIKLFVGPYDRYHLPQPTEAILATHPTLNTDILEQLMHGMVEVRPATESASGQTVTFADGSSDEFDAIIWATGFKLLFPYFRDGMFDWSNDTRVPLYMKIMPADYDNIFFVGLIQPLGCIWALADLQAEVVAHAITGRWKRPPDIADRIEQEHMADSKRFRQTVRHSVEVDFHDYKQLMMQQIRSVAS